MPVTTRYVTIGVLDIEAFGKRSGFLQKALRAQLRDIVLAALAGAGLDRGSVLVGVVDRGDGFALLIDANVGKEIMTTRFVDALAEGLRRHALASTSAGRIRLKLVLHAGQVVLDDEFEPDPTLRGWSGPQLNTACRLVDSPVLGRVLTAAPESLLVVGLSDAWYQEVVGGDWVDGGPYRAVPIRLKEGVETVHLRVPGLETPPWPDGLEDALSASGVGPAAGPPAPGPPAQGRPEPAVSVRVTQHHHGNGDNVGRDKNVYGREGSDG